MYNLLHQYKEAGSLCSNFYNLLHISNNQRHTHLKDLTAEKRLVRLTAFFRAVRQCKCKNMVWYATVNTIVHMSKGYSKASLQKKGGWWSITFSTLHNLIMPEIEKVTSDNLKELIEKEIFVLGGFDNVQMVKRKKFQSNMKSANMILSTVMYILWMDYLVPRVGKCYVWFYALGINICLYLFDYGNFTTYLLLIYYLFTTFNATLPHNAYTRYPPQLHTIPNVDHWGKDWAKWVSPCLYSRIYLVQRQAKS